MVELIVRLLAEADITVAHAWYSEQHEPLGEQFAAALTHTIDRIRANPGQFPDVGSGVRRALVQRFPYAVYFVEHEGCAHIIAVLVSVADKIHNVGAIIADYRTDGDALWARFNADAGKAGTVGYYRGLVTAYRAAPASVQHSRAVDDLDRLVTELEELVGMPGAWPPVRAKVT